jgi:hypothetical protein
MIKLGCSPNLFHKDIGKAIGINKHIGEDIPKGIGEGIGINNDIDKAIGINNDIDKAIGINKDIDKAIGINKDIDKRIRGLIEEYLSSRSEIEKEGSSQPILTGVESITWSFPFAQSNSMIFFFLKLHFLFNKPL